MIGYSTGISVAVSVQDFFAYLSSRFVVLLGLDCGLGPGLIPRDGPNPHR